MLWSRLEWSQDQWSSLTLLSRGHLLPLCFGFPYYGPTFPLNSQHVCSKWSSAPANQGNPFTWHNKRNDSDTIFSRLDRAMANQVWVQLNPSTAVNHLPIIGMNLFKTHGISSIWNKKLIGQRGLAKIGLLLGIKIKNFFQIAATIWRRHNDIHKILDENGIWPETKILFCRLLPNNSRRDFCWAFF